MLADGSLLCPLRGIWADGTGDALLFRSGDGGETWRLHRAIAGFKDELSIVEVDRSGVLLGHIRHGYRWGHPEDDRIYALEVWSEDNGMTWTHPVEASFQGYPNHLLKLRDGRILCTFGYRRKPMGVRALISEDGGRTWDLDREHVLRDDGGTTSDAWGPEKQEIPGFGSSDVGYPTSVELAENGSIVTVYYITTPDAITHVAATRWHVDEDRS